MLVAFLEVSACWLGFRPVRFAERSRARSEDMQVRISDMKSDGSRVGWGVGEDQKQGQNEGEKANEDDEEGYMERKEMVEDRLKVRME